MTTNEEEFLILNSENSATTDQLDLEVIRYLNDSNNTLLSLESYPNIKQVFIRFNTNLCSSASVERLFSFAKLINAPNRGNINDENFERLIFLKGNSDYY